MSYDANDRPVIFYQQRRTDCPYLRLRLPGKTLQQEGHRQRFNSQPLLVPLPGLFAGGPTGFDAPFLQTCENLSVGSDGTDGLAYLDDGQLKG